jgi:hypothetical protein
MKNIFLKFLFLILLGSIGNVLNAQEYHSKEAVFEKLSELKVEANETIAELENDKDMTYYKAVATVDIIDGLVEQLDSNKTVEEVFNENNSTITINKVQRIKPLFPDSNGKYGSKWINEEILDVFIVK